MVRFAILVPFTSSDNWNGHNCLPYCTELYRSVETSHERFVGEPKSFFPGITAKHPSFFRYELHLWYCYSVFMLFIKIASHGWNIIKGSKYWQIVLFLGWTKLFFYSWALRTCCCRRLFTHCIDRMPWCKKGLSFWTCCVMLLITASLTAVWISAIRHICN